MVNKYRNYEDEGAKLEYQRALDEINIHIGIQRHNDTIKIYNSCKMMLAQYLSLLEYLRLPEEEPGIPLKPALVMKLQTAVDEKMLVAASAMTSFLDMVNNSQSWVNVDFFCEVKEKNEQIMKQGNNSFLKKIRQYLNHYGLIPWIHDWNDNNTFKFYIDAEKMLEFDGWNKSDKKILRNLGLREISLQSIIDSYLKEIVALWSPALSTLYRMNREDLDETNVMKEKAFLSLTKGNFSTPEELYRNMENDFMATLYKTIKRLQNS